MRTGSKKSLSCAVLLCAPFVGAVLVAQGKGIDQHLANRYPEDAPGCVAAVSKDGKILSIHARGIAEMGTDRKITEDSRFYLASVSKQFTAACVHVLARQKKLSLDDDVRKYVPALPDYGHKITVRHLIYHRSGLRDYFELLVLAKKNLAGSHSHEDVLELVCRQKGLNFEPGSEFLYSNTGYLLLAEIVARVSGNSLREFAKQNIFDPLAMKHTTFRDVPGEKIDGAVQGHDAARPHITKFHLVGSGGVVSTARDLAKWAMALDRGALIDDEFVATLQTPIELEADQGRDPSLGHYAAGMLVGTFSGRPTVWHPGGSLGFSTCLLRFPKEKLTITVLCNSTAGGARATAFRIAEMKLGVDPRPAAVGSTKSPRAGRYFFLHPRTQEFMVSIVRGSGSKLAVAAWDIEMRSVDATVMSSVGSAIPVSARFIYRDDAPADIEVKIGEQSPFLCKGFRAERVAAAELESLIGTWRSEETGASLDLAASPGGMKITDELQANPGPLYAIRRDLLISNDGFAVAVERDKTKKVTGFRVSTKGSRGILYTR